MKDRYEIIELLGSGGFGSVYKSRDTQLDRNVAIKRLKAERYVDHLELRDQLLAEAKVLAGLCHPNIVTIYDVIQTETGGDIVMELIEGTTLCDLVQEGPLSVHQFLFIATQLLSAITTSHEHKIIHCDLKPGNIMLTRLEDDNFQATVLDFGMSPSMDADPSTKTGAIKLVGSIYFMAPEQLDAGITNTKSDIYSLGCLFYYMLTGEYAFDGDSPIMVMASHVTNKFTPLKELRPELPHSLCDWVEAHIRLKPENRTSSCRDALNDLLHLEDLKALETFSEMTPGKKMSSTMLHSLSALSKSNLKISEQQKKEFAARKSTSPASSAPKNLTPLSQRFTQTRPSSLWYFSIDDVRKGPVHFDKVCDLIAQGFIRSNDKIWHQRIGQWTPAIEVSEFKDEFKAAEAMPPRAKKKKVVSNRSSGISSKKPIKRVTNPQRILVEKSYKELIITAILVAISAFVIYRDVDLWQKTLLCLSAALFICGFVFNRMQMKRYTGILYLVGTFLPVVGDLIFAIKKPHRGIPSVIMMLLSFAFFSYAMLHRYPDDVLSSLNNIESKFSAEETKK